MARKEISPPADQDSDPSTGDSASTNTISSSSSSDKDSSASNSFNFCEITRGSSAGSWMVFSDPEKLLKRTSKSLAARGSRAEEMTGTKSWGIVSPK